MPKIPPTYRLHARSVRSDDPKSPVVDLVNPPKRGLRMEYGTLDRLFRVAKYNKATRILVVFEYD